jgi:hypothetical protein
VVGQSAGGIKISADVRQGRDKENPNLMGGGGLRAYLSGLSGSQMITVVCEFERG